MDKDDDNLVFGVAYKTEAFINDRGNISIRQHNDINPIQGTQYDYQDVLIEIPLHHLDALVSHLIRVQGEYLEALEVNEE